MDKISQTPGEFYIELASNPEHPKTSQPTPGDFRRQYQYLQSHYDSIISIHIPHVLSGTYQSALNASKRVTNSNISVMDGFSASVGLGLIAMRAAELTKEGKKHEDIIGALPEIIKTTNIYLAIKDMSYIVKGGRLPKWVKNIADILHIRPILTTKEDGTMGVAGVLKGTQNLSEKLAAFVSGKLDGDAAYTISIGHANSPKEGEILRELLQMEHPNLKSIYLMEMGCALGVHAGPGSLTVGVLKNT